MVVRFAGGWLNCCLIRWWLVEWLFASLVIGLMTVSTVVG